MDELVVACSQCKEMVPLGWSPSNGRPLEFRADSHVLTLLFMEAHQGHPLVSGTRQSFDYELVENPK